MRSLAAAGCLLMLLACTAACSAGHAGGDARWTVLPVVTYTPKSGTPIPSDLIEASPFALAGSVHSGFACFTMGGVPVDWPAGYSAVRGSSGTLEVRDKAGRLIRTGRAQYLEVLNMPSAGNACSADGQMMTAILSLPKSA